MDLEKLKKDNKLTVNNGKIYIKPISDNSFIAYPLYDLSGCIEITVDEYLGLLSKKYKIKSDLTGIEVRK